MYAHVHIHVDQVARQACRTLSLTHLKWFRIFCRQITWCFHVPLQTALGVSARISCELPPEAQATQSGRPWPWMAARQTRCAAEIRDIHCHPSRGKRWTPRGYGGWTVDWSCFRAHGGNALAATTASHGRRRSLQSLQSLQRLFHWHQRRCVFAWAPAGGALTAQQLDALRSLRILWAWHAQSSRARSPSQRPFPRGPVHESQCEWDPWCRGPQIAPIGCRRPTMHEPSGYTVTLRCHLQTPNSGDRKSAESIVSTCGPSATRQVRCDTSFHWPTNLGFALRRHPEPVVDSSGSAPAESCNSRWSCSDSCDPRPSVSAPRKRGGSAAEAPRWGHAAGNPGPTDAQQRWYPWLQRSRHQNPWGKMKMESREK